MASRNQTNVDEYRSLTVKEIQRLNDLLEKLQKKIEDINTAAIQQVSDLKIKVAVLETELKLKSGVWGFAAGLIPSIAVAVIVLLHK
jgi:hypothetical protein